MTVGAEQNAAYYDEKFAGFLAGPEGQNQAAKMRLLANAVAEHVDGDVLDLGCGFGYLSVRCGAGGYLGLDFSPYAVGIARTKWGETAWRRFAVADVFDLPAGLVQHDTVVLCEVLEHVQDRERLAEVALLLTRRRVVATVPVDMPEPSHVWPAWTPDDLKALFGPLSLCEKIVDGAHWLAVKEV